MRFLYLATALPGEEKREVVMETMRDLIRSGELDDYLCRLIGPLIESSEA